MKKLILTFLYFVFITLVLFVTPSTFAIAPISLVQTSLNSTVKVEEETTVQTEQSKTTNETVASSEFEITGEITSVAENSIVINNETVFIDDSQSNKFKQQDLLTIGKVVKIKGFIKNETMYAQEISVIGNGQSQLKLETEGTVKSVSSFLDQILNFLSKLVK